ncbi:MAG: hypothetical protein EA397_01810 [Deltaproteobacteria bacterium]|nr:MAG: hypothetical protein EA397_01810 [Deltaproteobacteria bacterium]
MHPQHVSIRIVLLSLGSSLVVACQSGGGSGLGGAALSPAEPTTTDNLVLYLQGAPASEVATRWSMDGQSQPELDDAVQVSSSLTAKGQSWSVQVAQRGSEPDGSVEASVSIRNSPPEIARAFVQPERPRRGEELTCAAVGWFDADGDPSDNRITWSTGDAGSTLSTESMEVGDRVSCTITPFDGEEEGEPKTSPEVVLGQDGPTVLTASLPTDLRTQDDVVPSFTFVPDTSQVLFSFDWTVNGTSVSDVEVLSSAYTAKGDTVRVRITPRQGEEQGQPFASNRVTVLNTAPEIHSFVLQPSAPGTLQSVTANVVDEDPDPADTLVRTFTWTINGSEVSETGPTLDDARHRKGDRIRARVVVSDGTESVEAESAEIVVVNTPPTAPDIAIEGSEVDEDLSCVIVRGASDPDPTDTIHYEYGWFVDGRETGRSEDFVYADDTADGEVWTCEVHAVDSDGARGPVARATVVVGGGSGGGPCEVRSVAKSHISMSRSSERVLEEYLHITSEDDPEIRLMAFMFFPFEEAYPSDWGDIAAMELELTFVAFEAALGSDRALLFWRPEEAIPWSSDGGPYEHLVHTHLRPHLTLPVEEPGPGRRVIRIARERFEELEIIRFWEEMKGFTLAIGANDEPTGERTVLGGTFDERDAPVLRLRFERCDEEPSLEAVEAAR